MNNNRKRTALCLLGATLCVFMAFGAALYFGRYPITLQALLAGDAMAVRTFTVLRLPRAVMALAGGFGLGVAGFVYQTVFRNPLASPDIIGVSSGASVGAAFAILFVSSGTLGTTVCAFAGGLAAVFLSLGLAAAACRMIWCSDLDFSLHAFRLRADYFLLEPVSEEAFRRGLNAWIE